MPHLLYDPDCGFCTATAHRLGRRGWGTSIEPLTPTWLADPRIDAERALREIPFVPDGGPTRYGAAAFAAALGTGNRAERALGRLMQLPLVSSAAQAAYRQIARNRHRLPGASSTCRLP